VIVQSTTGVIFTTQLMESAKNLGRRGAALSHQLLLVEALF